MAEENVPAPSPKRSDKHILSFNAWLPVRKGNLLLYLQKLQKNPIFRISVDILQNTNFFRAFTASANVLTIYIQEFWNTLVQDAKTEFVPKGEKDEVFRKPIPQELITEVIQNSPYYQQLEMVARKPTAKKGEQKKGNFLKLTSPKNDESSQEKRYDLLVDEEDEEPQVEDDEYNLQRGITQRLPVVEGKGKGIATDEQSRIPATHDAPTGPSAQPQDDTSANVVHDTLSPADVETGADTKKSNSEGDTEILNVDEERALLMEEDQAGSNPGQSHVVLAGPNPEPMHEKFVDTVYPQVHESSKHKIEEHVHIENPLSSSGTLSSMKNLDDAFTFGDQFLNDKPTKEEPRKTNVWLLPITSRAFNSLRSSRASMDRENMEEFIEATAKSRKRRRDDQDLLHPPLKRQSDQKQKKRHDYDASASKQPPVQKPSTWTSSDTREAPSSSSKQKTAPQSEQPVDDVPIPDDVHISDTT
ncbi:hypothetical protein Tco_1193009 [Tanacetum coccineum]